MIPSKYDIIPIHTSDRAAFKECRRKWNWSSPARNNLVRRVSVHGVYPPFWFGTGIHHALEKYYDPSYTEDCTVAFETWFNLQVNGGYITEKELEQFADHEPVLKEDGLYHIQGLADLMSFFDPDEFDGYLELGIGMMEYYKQWAPEHDNFTVIAVEQSFSVPILDDQGAAIYMYDSRVMPEDWEPDFSASNEYGPLMDQIREPELEGFTNVKQVHARGRIDIIIQDNETGFYGIQDYKTASRVDEDYFRHLDLDEQVSTYAFCAEQMAQMYDLPYKDISFINYQAMLKAYPKLPTVTKRGFPLSIAKSTESTTAALFAEALDVIPGARMLYERNEAAQSYYTWLIETEDKRFINRYVVRRNRTQKYNCGRRLYLEAMDMLSDGLRIYPNPTKNYSCLNCFFRSPCVMVEDGGDYKLLLEDGFVKNYDR